MSEAEIAVETAGWLTRRRYRRIAVQMGVRISTIDPEYDPDTGKPYFRTCEETCSTVSEGGAFVPTGEAISPGRRLLLEIEMPEGPKIEAIGRVAWSRTRVVSGEVDGAAPLKGADDSACGMGIEFLDGEPTDLERLASYLERVSPARPASAPSEARPPYTTPSRGA